MSQERQRIDKWLFFARAAKSRSIAAKLVQAGRVRVDGEKIDQASHPVKPGETLTITLDRQIRILKVVAPGARRGPFEEARLLYEDLTPAPDPTRTPMPSELGPVRQPGAGRPTKRERRQLDAWTARDED
ncbi:RNA-binding S4 domain-containing protein [Pararhizobium haloflavum]|uniref:RNA-binding S4 domain-containing protein n=1 Tax=Pararhizobium haloflavum TaxID=2037914 RepID=UPI000C19E98C|nr:RNA-binding S4 domain-containing protein [Pararhizobium haloflavum]